MFHVFIIFTSSWQGKKLWGMNLPAPITCIESIVIQNLAKELVAVAMEDCNVFIYSDKYLVDVIRCEGIVVSMRFGHYGRESNALVLILKGS